MPANILRVDSSQLDLVDPDTSSPFRYGWFGFTPPWLQWVNKAGWFVFFMFWANTVQSFVANGLVGVVLSTLEKRFGLTSSQSSWIAGTYDLAGVPMILLISYIGSRAHRPRWTAFGELAVCLGAILFVIPHFATDEYIPKRNQEDNYLCETSRNVSRTCEESGVGPGGGDLTAYLALFIFARIVMGMGAEPLFTHAVTYLDDIVTKQDFSLYIVFCYVGGVLGPAIAYVAGGYVLTIYTDWRTVDTGHYELNISDPRWVGAWWVNFVIGAVALLLVGLPFTGYARDIPGAAQIREEKTSEAHTTPSGEDDLDDVPVTGEVHLTMAEIPAYLKYLFTNVTYMGMVIFGICDALLVAGFAAFGPKYIETQFNVGPSTAAMVFGVVTIPGGVGGLLVGGGLIKRYNLKLTWILRGLTIFTLLTLTTISMFFLRCDGVPLAGVTASYNDTDTQSVSRLKDPFNKDVPGLEAPCNQECQCVNIPITPVCGIDQRHYFSPCHAGCQGVRIQGDLKMYYNCTCIKSDAFTDDGMMATSEDTCQPADCIVMPIFLVMFLLAMFFLFAGQGMVPSVVMRCVLSTHRTVAIGIQGMLSKLIGGLMGPLVFGVAFDGACLRSDQHCGVTGSCLTYDSWSIALNMFLLCTLAKVLSLIASVLALWFYHPPKDEVPPMELIGPPEFTMEHVNAGFQHQVNGGLTLHMNDPTEKVSSSEFEEDITEGVGESYEKEYRRIMSEL